MSSLLESNEATAKSRAPITVHTSSHRGYAAIAELI
jgi:hypothetical protein